MQLADRGINEVNGPCVRTAPQREQGPAVSIAPKRAHDVGDGVIIAHTVRKSDDSERVIAKSGDRIDLAAGIDGDGQTRAVIDDVDMGRAIDDRLIAKPDKVKLV